MTHLLAPLAVEIHPVFTKFLNFTLVGFLPVEENHNFFSHSIPGKRNGKEINVFPIFINDKANNTFFVDGELFDYATIKYINPNAIKEIQSRQKKELNKFVLELKKTDKYNKDYDYAAALLWYGTEFQKFLTKRIAEENPFMIFVQGAIDISFVSRYKTRKIRDSFLSSINLDEYSWYSN